MENQELTRIAEEAAFQAVNAGMEVVADAYGVGKDGDENPYDFGGWASLFCMETETELVRFFEGAMESWEAWVARHEGDKAEA